MSQPIDWTLATLLEKKWDDLLHYIEPTLKDGSFNTAAVYVGVNDFLKGKRMHSLDELVTNLRSITLKYCSLGITKLYINGIVVNNKMSGSLLESINTKMSEVYREDFYGFIDKRNIQRVYL